MDCAHLPFSNQKYKLIQTQMDDSNILRRRNLEKKKKSFYSKAMTIGWSVLQLKKNKSK